jgi:hypothetical protein
VPDDRNVTDADRAANALIELVDAATRTRACHAGGRGFEPRRSRLLFAGVARLALGDEVVCGTRCGQWGKCPVRVIVDFEPNVRRADRASGDRLDDLDQLVDPVALAAGELDERPGLSDHSAHLRRARHRDPSTPPKLEQPFVPELA